MKPITFTHHDKNKDPSPSNIHTDVIYIQTHLYIKRNNLNAVDHLQLEILSLVQIL